MNGVLLTGRFLLMSWIASTMMVKVSILKMPLIVLFAHRISVNVLSKKLTVRAISVLTTGLMK